MDKLNNKYYNRYNKHLINNSIYIRKIHNISDKIFKNNIFIKLEELKSGNENIIRYNLSKYFSMSSAITFNKIHDL